MELSKQDTLYLKGIALILLLTHHLFGAGNGGIHEYLGIPNGSYSDVYWGGTHFGLVHLLGVGCKVCVAVFVFLSGYGLIKSYKNSIMNFYIKGLSKLYMNYWFIWIVFVPFGVFVFERTFTVVYGNWVYERPIIDVLGFADSFGFGSYNATWWFYSCILILYVLFPILRFFVKRKSVILLLFSTFFMLLPLPQMLLPIKFYLLPFVLGMIWAEKNLFDKCRISLLLIVLLLIILVFLRFRSPYFSGLYVDPFLAVNIIYFSMWIRLRITKLSNVMVFIGKHSFNIFLFHTFIYLYYFQSLIYYFKNPILIFTLLLVICLILSVVMEKVKNYIGYYKLQEYLYFKLLYHK